jgi:phenylalanine ammonia-lyase
MEAVAEKSGDGVRSDPLNWACAAEAMKGCHLDEVKGYVKTYYEAEEVVIEGKDLTVAHVAVIARRPEVVFKLNAGVAKSRVDECSDWIVQSIKDGRDINGVTTGFGAASHRRTNQALQLQLELIR